MALYNKQFSSDLNFNSNIKPNKTLIIASTPRCGSHMLGHSLFTTKKFGFPLEYFQQSNFIEWKAILKTKEINQTIEALHSIRTSPNGIFSMKMHYAHLQQFESFQHLLTLFPNPYFVLLTRSNVLKQAISYSLALQTGVWIDGQKSNNVQPKYNFEQINNKLNLVLEHNAAWRYLLLTHNCRFIEVDFDNAKNNIQETIKKIAAFMNIALDESNITIVEPPTKNQRSHINSEWLEKYIKDYDGRELNIMNKRKSGRISKFINKLKTFVNT